MSLSVSSSHTGKQQLQDTIDLFVVIHPKLLLLLCYMCFSEDGEITWNTIKDASRCCTYTTFSDLSTKSARSLKLHIVLVTFSICSISPSVTMLG